MPSPCNCWSGNCINALSLLASLHMHHVTKSVSLLIFDKFTCFGWFWYAQHDTSVLVIDDLEEICCGGSNEFRIYRFHVIFTISFQWGSMKIVDFAPALHQDLFILHKPQPQYLQQEMLKKIFNLIKLVFNCENYQFHST